MSRAKGIEPRRHRGHGAERADEQVVVDPAPPPLVSVSLCLCGALRFVFCASLCLPFSATLYAQGPLDLQAGAVAGEPFGVGQIEFMSPPNVRLDAGGGEPVILQERNGRLLYPAFSKQPVRGLLRSLINRPQRMTAWFLFRGVEPLEISIPELSIGPFLVRPVADDLGQPQLLASWWRAYTSEGPLGGLFSGQDATPPDVKDYLTAMLAARLRLPPPWLGEEPALSDPMDLLLGSEKLRTAALRNAFDRPHGEKADQPLPEPIKLPVAELGEPPADVKVESLAAHVPEECFYVRFGSFGNFQWCRTYLSDTGGDIRQLVSARGLDYGLNTRLEQQLVLKTSVLSKLFGDLLISDVAMIGNDTFLREGAAMGLLFESRNNGLLSNNFQTQRLTALKENPAAREELVEIAGRSVSYISTPDGNVRSYYAVDGDYHFFATSRALVQRFFEVGAGERSLAVNRQFRHARADYPLSRGDSVFAFLSTAFMEQLIGPRYRIEMDRRLAASVDLELMQLARLAAKAEGRPHASTEELIGGGFLPAGFGQRCDGSHCVPAGEGLLADSFRSGRGAFLSVPDVAVDHATASEVDGYRALTHYLSARLEYVEPWLMAIKRFPHANQGERVTVDLRFSPSAGSFYEFLARWLGDGPPTPKRVEAVSGNVLAVEALIGGRQTFAGLRDCNPLRIFGMEGENIVDRLLISLTSFPTDTLVGYVGVAGKGGGLEFLGDFRFAPPDPQGFSRSRGPVWRRQWENFAVLSFHPRVLEEVVPRLTVVDAARPAHGRIRVADLRDTQFAMGIDSFVARRAKAVSMGNVHFMDSLIQQMHVPPAECQGVAESLLGGKLVCPVGGKFVLAQPNRPQASRWSWAPPTAPARPANGTGPAYLADVLNWFRGLEGDAVVEGRTIRAHLEIASQPPASVRPAPPAVEEVKRL